MQSDTGNEKKGIRRINLIIPLIIILFLMVAMVLFTSNIINRISVANIQEAGADKLSGITAKLENYLDTSFFTPIPVSLTEKTSLQISSSRSIIDTDSANPPVSVYFTAFVSRFNTICLIFP